MRHYVVQISRVSGEPTAMAVTENSDENEAIMLWHQICASIRATANIEYAQVFVRNEVGAIVADEIIPEALNE